MAWGVLLSRLTRFACPSGRVGSGCLSMVRDRSRTGGGPSSVSSVARVFGDAGRFDAGRAEMEWGRMQSLVRPCFGRCGVQRSLPRGVAVVADVGKSPDDGTDR